MPLDLARFMKVRPWLYHLTARSNLKLIVASRQLRPAAELLEEAGESHAKRQRRRESRMVVCGGEHVHVRDQAPLHEGNLKLSGNWSFGDFVDHLNQHVFLWPGTDAGPIDYGQRHFERYAQEDNVVLVFKTVDLFASQPNLKPRFSRYNSGSPRWSNGRPSPRGPDTFLTAHEFDGTPSSVVEVTFRGPLTLNTGDLVSKPLKHFL